MKVFVPGRICLFGEHSDWAGGYRRINAEVEKGYTLLSGTDQGVYAEVEPHPTALVLTSSHAAADFATPFVETTPVGGTSKEYGYLVSLGPQGTDFLVIVMTDQLEFRVLRGVADKGVVEDSVLGKRAVIQARVLKQMAATASGVNTVNGAIILLGVVVTLSHFVFARRDGGALGGAAKLGRYFMMAFFGATFAYTVMSRVALLIGRSEFLLRDWLGILGT